MKYAFLNVIGIVAASVLFGAACPPVDVYDNNPFMLVTQDATDIGFDSATLNADVDLTDIRYNNLTYGFYLGTSEASIDKEVECTSSSRPSNPKFSFSVQLSDLKPKTRYWFKAYVMIGRHVFYGNAKSFTTGEFRCTAVDMGLSVKWATVNVGANKPEEYGDYFAWGETKPKSEYSWNSYKWAKGDYDKLTKYCTYYDYWAGTDSPDKMTKLLPVDDAASANLGGKWRMPTFGEWHELLDKDNCEWTWDKCNGVNGYYVKSKKNGNSIFLPAAGFRTVEHPDPMKGYMGCYWSSSVNEFITPDYVAWYISFYSELYEDNLGYRFNGFTVRPVTD